MPVEAEPTGICWDRVRRDLENTEWTDTGDQYERKTFIGTVFSLYPSGKYYMPWACSNLDKCERCNGKGSVEIKKHRRLQKKWHAAKKRVWKLAEKFKIVGDVVALEKHGWYRYYRTLNKIVIRRNFDGVCPHCNGMGSREAYLDERFFEQLEKEASRYGLFVTGGEGDPCDIFVGECCDELPDEE